MLAGSQFQLRFVSFLRVQRLGAGLQVMGGGGGFGRGGVGVQGYV